MRHDEWQQLLTLANEHRVAPLFYHRLLRLFQHHNIQVIVLKGACLANTVYTYAGLRVMMDLDLLLPVERMSQAVALLLANGYQPQSALGQVITDYFPILHQLPPSNVQVRRYVTIAAPDLGHLLSSCAGFAPNSALLPCTGL